MNSIRGIILVTVLIFLHVIAVLGLFALRIAWLETKQSQAAWRQHSMQNKADLALQQAETQLEQVTPYCVIPVTSTAELIAHPLSWWQTSVSCAGNFQLFQYYYVVELIGVDPCAEIGVSTPKKVADYFRITLLGVMGETKTILQSTVIKTHEGSAPPCEGKMHSVFLGRQMWREISM